MSVSMLVSTARGLELPEEYPEAGGWAQLTARTRLQLGQSSGRPTVRINASHDRTVVTSLLTAVRVDKLSSCCEP